MERESPFGFDGHVSRLDGCPDSSAIMPTSAPLMSTADRFQAAFGRERLPPVTVADFKQLMAAADVESYGPDLREIAVIAYCTALRAEELLRLRWVEVNFADREIFVLGHRDREDRWVPFSKLTDATLRTRRAREPSAHYVLGKSPQRTLDQVSLQLQALSMKVLKRRVSLDSLRLGFFDWFRSVNGNPGQLALIAGTRVHWNSPRGPSEALRQAAAQSQAWFESLV